MAKGESKSFEPAAIEKKIFAMWQEGGYFEANPDAGGEAFCMVIPPPNVTGALHLGHALNNTLQDILIRRERMKGKNAFWLIGTDHAGIATQATVEKTIRQEERKSRHDLGREELVRRIWEWKHKFGGRIVEQLKLMGCSCDYTRERFTLDDICAKAVRHTFFKLFRDGLIYRGKRLVNWDTQLQTAVADDEVYHETVKGHFYHFKYPIKDPKPGEPAFVHIATTRPETMLGDTAVAVHPDPERALGKVEQELREKLASASEKEKAAVQASLDDVAKRREAHLPTLLKLRDMARDGRMVTLPLVDRPIPLVCDEWAKPELGSGCVKITPAHDPNDYEVGGRHDLPKVNVLTEDGHVAEIIEPDGTVNANSSNYAGLRFATEGRKKVVADLEAAGLIEEIEGRKIELGHSDRSKAPIEPFLSDQWFVKMGDLDSEPSEPGRANEPRGASEPRGGSEPRTSVRAEPTLHRSPDLSQGAVLVTWTTYGTWLPGDERGFVSRVPQADGEHTIHNMPGEPYDADDARLRNDAANRLEGEPVHLNADHARVLLSSIATSAERHGIELLAVAIMADHVHVLCQTERSGPELQKLFKGAASHLLGRRFQLHKSPRWFTRRGSNRFIKKGSDLTPAIDYVLQQHRPLLVWGWDSDGGEAAKVVSEARAEERASQRSERGTSARTKVRGSQGDANEPPKRNEPRRKNEPRTSVRADEPTQGHRTIISDASGSQRSPRFVTLADGSRAPGLAQAAIDAVESGKVTFHPARYKKTYIDWLSEKRDWCISRQLWWGHRIPVWVKRSTIPESICIDELEAHTQRIEWTGFTVKREWVDRIWIQSRIVRETRAGEAHCCVAPGNPEIEADLEEQGFARDPDVLDTWFSSALWPHSTLGWPDAGMAGVDATGGTASARTEVRGSLSGSLLGAYYPTNVLSTAREIITLWVARMVMTGLYNVGEVPFSDVVIHPVIQDGQGRKMSKTLGNGVDPVDIIDKYGADALRFTLADLATETQDIRMPVQKEKLPDGREINVSPKFEKGRNFCNKLWQAATGYVLRNADGYSPTPLDPTAMRLEDRWILSRLTGCLQDVDAALDRYRLSEAIETLYHFMWDDYCSAYIEMTKSRFDDPKGGPDRGSAQQVLIHVLDQLLRMLHPFIPFVTEATWSELNAAAPNRGIRKIAAGEPVLIAAAWPTATAAWRDEAVEAQMADLQAIIKSVREIRTTVNDHRGKAGRPSMRTLPSAVVLTDAKTAEMIERHSAFVRPLAGCDALEVRTDGAKPLGAMSSVMGDVHVYVPVADLIDLATVRAAEEKKLTELRGLLAQSEKKLSNENFVKRADPAVVEQARQRAAELAVRITAVEQHLADLK